MNRRIREILRQYVDACELIRETEADIRKLKRRKAVPAADVVKGSNPEYPYNEQHFKVDGDDGCAAASMKERRIEREEEILRERIAAADSVRLEAERVISAAPVRIQRIIRYRYMESLSWRQTAARMRGNASEDSVRKELERFLKDF